MSPQPTHRAKSTGPRTAAGKRASAKNALQHGLASGTILMDGEDPDAFENLTQHLVADFKPKNAVETILVTQMAKHHWLANRALRLQAEVLSSENRKRGEIPASLSVLLRYQNANQRGFRQCLETLNSLRKQELAAAKQFVSQPAKTPRPQPATTPQPEPVADPEAMRAFLAASPALAQIAQQCGFGV